MFLQAVTGTNCFHIGRRRDILSSLKTAFSRKQPPFTTLPKKYIGRTCRAKSLNSRFVFVKRVRKNVNSDFSFIFFSSSSEADVGNHVLYRKKGRNDSVVLNEAVCLGFDNVICTVSKRHLFFSLPYFCFSISAMTCIHDSALYYRGCRPFILFIDYLAGSLESKHVCALLLVLDSILRVTIYFLTTVQNFARAAELLV